MSPLPRDFADAYSRFLPPIRAKCRRILGRTAVADEIAQEAFTRLWQSGPRLDGRTDTRTIMAWLYVTSTRLALDALREGRVVSIESIEHAKVEPMSCAVTPADVAAARSTILAMRRLVPPEELEAALLTRVDGLSQTEVAAALGLSERTIRRRLDKFDSRSAELRKEVVE